MICYSCGHCSLHVACPYCGARDIRQVVGWSPLDLLNPFGLGQKVVQEGPIPTVAPDPYSLGRAAGEEAVKSTTLAQSSVLRPFADLATTFKWLFIGGAVVVGGTILYSVYQAWKADLPGRSLEAFRESERGSKELAGRFLSKGGGR